MGRNTFSPGGASPTRARWTDAIAAAMPEGVITHASESSSSKTCLLARKGGQV